MKYFFIVIAILAIGSCTKRNEQASQDQYTCPMHPSVIQDHPGTCPVCGMQLVKRGQPGQEVKITSELSYLLKPTDAVVMASIKTMAPAKKSMDAVFGASGVIAYDTRRITSLPLRYSGRIEKLYLKYNFQSIKKGQKVLEIYSPELAASQRDLLYLLKSDKDNVALIESAKEKLRLLGVTNTQIDDITKSGKEVYSFQVYSPADGYVVEEGVATEEFSTITTEFQTRDGMYVTAGQSVFNIINTDVVWAEVDVNQKDGVSLKVNDPIQIIFEGTDSIQSKIDFVQPFFSNGENFKKIRVYLKNPGNKHAIGQWFKASFIQSSEKSLWIPRSAKLDMGTREIVFTKWRGALKPRVVVTGKQAGDWIEIIGGVDATDSVAINAQFLIDSESFIKIKN